jgi:hypothetical protein
MKRREFIAGLGGAVAWAIDTRAAGYHADGREGQLRRLRTARLTDLQKAIAL